MATSTQIDSRAPKPPKQDFSSLSVAEQEIIRAKQIEAKDKKKRATKDDAHRNVSLNSEKRGGKDYPTRISEDEYFAACPCRMFYDRQLKATEEAVGTIVQLVDNHTVVGHDDRGKEITLADFQYFVLAGTQKTIWDPQLYARLAYEGFFTITTNGGPHGGTEPLPELQPFYGVVDWDNFNNSKTVRKTLKKVRHQLGIDSTTAPVDTGSLQVCEGRCNYHMYANFDLDGTYKKLDAYQKKQHGSNWMTSKYFETMKCASEDPSINFKLHSIELYDGPLSPPTAVATSRSRSWFGSGSTCNVPQTCRLLAGEIGYSIGQVYTSLSGFYEVDGCGTVQLVILGRWLARNKYAFWSLGHCYSPHMEYKRQLGHRVYPRSDFLQKLREQRGPFRAAGASLPTFPHFSNGEECNIPDVLTDVAEI